MDTITTIQDLLKCNGSAQSVTVNLTESTSRLIAAAPVLLDRLIKSTRSLSVLCDHYEKEFMGVTSGSIAKMRKEMAINNEIIAKAKGE